MRKGKDFLVSVFCMWDNGFFFFLRFFFKMFILRERECAHMHTHGGGAQRAGRENPK